MASYFKLFNPKTAYHDAFINFCYLFTGVMLRGEALDPW